MFQFISYVNPVEKLFILRSNIQIFKSDYLVIFNVSLDYCLFLLINKINSGVPVTILYIYIATLTLIVFNS